MSRYMYLFTLSNAGRKIPLPITVGVDLKLFEANYIGKGTPKWYSKKDSMPTTLAADCEIG